MDESEFGVEVIRGWSGGLFFDELNEENEFLRFMSDDFWSSVGVEISTRAFFEGFLRKLEKLNCDLIFLKKFPLGPLFSLSSRSLSYTAELFDGVWIPKLLSVDLFDELLPTKIFEELVDKFVELLEGDISTDFLLFLDKSGDRIGLALR